SEAHSIVFTNFLPPGREPTIIDPNRELALTLGKPFVAVALVLDAEEILRRVGNPDRAAHLKLTDATFTRHLIDQGQTLPTHWPELRRLDIDGLSASKAADRIIAMAGDGTDESRGGPSSPPT